MRDKAEIRALMLLQRQALGQRQRQLNSDLVVTLLHEHVSRQPILPKCLLIYRSLSSEVKTDGLLVRSEYDVFAPLTHSDASMQWRKITADTDWRRGALGVLEPQDGDVWQQADGPTILLCPLTAFDRKGNRLGMGKGCFDLWLSQHRSEIKQVIGLAFACQEVDTLPVEGHDMPMDYVITEKEVIACMM